MAGIAKDLEDHMQNASQKYAFDFEKETPMQGVERDYEWVKVSNFSKSEVTGKKPRFNVFTDRKSTADTEKLFSARNHLNTSMFSQDASNMMHRESSLFQAPTYFENQGNPQRFAVLKPDFAANNYSIPEEKDENPSPG